MERQLDSNRWKRAQDLFHAARELRVTDREAFLDFHCKGDPKVCALVIRLLESTDDSSFLADCFDESRP